MKIIEIDIQGFGRLCGFKLRPSEGFNVISGANESGKTTLMSFIRAMLFGVGNKNDLREKYRPRSGVPMGGTLTFEHEGKAYRLERTFLSTAAKDVTALWNVISGEKIPLPAKMSPGEYVLGISADTFENTLFIKHNSSRLSGKCDDITARLNNIVSSGDENFSYGEVSQRLKNASKRYNSRAQDAIIPAIDRAVSSVGEEKYALELKINRLGQEIGASDQAKQQIAEIEKQIENTSLCAKKAEAIAEKERLEGIENSRRRMLSAQKELEDAKNAVTADGTEIDVQNIRQMRELWNKAQLIWGECAYIEENIKTSQGRLDEWSRVAQKNQILEQNSQELQALEGCGAKAKTVPLYLYILCILATAVLFAALYFTLGILPAVIAAAVGAVISAVVLTLLHNKIKKENQTFFRLSELLKACGCVSCEEFRTRLAQGRHAAEEAKKEKQALADMEQRLLDRKRSAQEKENEVREFTGRFTEADNMEPNKALAILEQALSRCGEAQRLHDAYYADYNRLSGDIKPEDLEKRLTDCDKTVSELSRVEAQEKPEVYRTLLLKLSEKKNALAADIALREHRGEQLKQLTRQMEELDGKVLSLNARRAKAEKIYTSLCIASDCLDMAFGEMQKSFSPLVNRCAGEYLGRLTGGKYSSVMVSRTLEPSVISPEDSRTYLAPDFSAGTTDQIYLALRLAVSEVIFGKGNYPVFLDDSLNQYDLGRMKLALECISKLDGQSFLFTCRQEEAMGAKEVGATLFNM